MNQFFFFSFFLLSSALSSSLVFTWDSIPMIVQYDLPEIYAQAAVYAGVQVVYSSPGTYAIAFAFAFPALSSAEMKKTALVNWLTSWSKIGSYITLDRVMYWKTRIKGST